MALVDAHLLDSVTVSELSWTPPKAVSALWHCAYIEATTTEPKRRPQATTKKRSGQRWSDKERASNFIHLLGTTKKYR